jgi:ABC-type antimicrobial peptide transport system permease subunit
MGAFQLRVDSVSVAVALITGLVIGVVGAIPPAIRAMRMPVVDALKAT